ncbi:class I SAM-dependent methyltransferase [Spirulina major]|uniref:class I SAM-dependent methyltransferase n=1 Tax=Spirulina major TaxID=270636 RepID=UPI000932669A|nr:methyltransferase domain-containing protein [Spirulina major]
MPELLNSFDVVYHSQVLEHFPKEKASFFMSECFRVLKPGGIIRVVVPDLENIVNEYIKCLNENLSNSNKYSEANYDWILLELYDQTVRNYSGGQMVEFLRQPELINEDYIVNRIGYLGKSIRDYYVATEINEIQTSYWKRVVKKIKKNSLDVFRKYLIPKTKSEFYSEAYKVGSFRLGGEVHMWMYDRFSLSRLLDKCGFKCIEIQTPHSSSIPEWSEYELDVKNDIIFDPTSLFMEAQKPMHS